MHTTLSSVQNWRRPMWLTLLIAASIAFTFAFACGVPFAALAAATALTLPRRDALLVTLGAWAVNQAVGFGFMAYPVDGPTIAWGAALAVVALMCVGAARVVAAKMQARGVLVSCLAAFLASFAVYEVALFAFSLVLGGTEHYTLAIQGRILAINVCAVLVLFALNHAASATRLVPAGAHSERHA